MRRMSKISELFTLPTKIEHDVLYIGSNVVKWKHLKDVSTEKEYLWLEVNGRTPFLVSCNKTSEEIAWKINAMF